MHLPPELDRLASLNKNELKRETEKLRCATAMTIYRGTFIPKAGLQKKIEGSDDDAKKKKTLLFALGALVFYYVYENFLI